MKRILWIIHNYPPHQNAGAEWMAVEINNYLLAKGYEVRVVNGTVNNPYVFEKVQVWDRSLLEDELRKADVVFTHLDMSEQVTAMCLILKKPVFNVIHHNFEIHHLRQKSNLIHLIYNTEWVKKDRHYQGGNGLILHPPVSIDRFAGVQRRKDGYVTLVNCNQDKGGDVIKLIAEANPHVKFLGVLGAHGSQVTHGLPNLDYSRNVTDICEAFKVTRTLIVPSIYESYGRIGIEALACGIPVIAAITPGLQESLGNAGIFVERDDIAAWSKQIYLAEPNDNLKIHASDCWKNSKAELAELDSYIQNLKK